MERQDLYQDDLTEERQPTPGDRAETADTIALDPDRADRENQQEGIEGHS